MVSRPNVTSYLIEDFINEDSRIKKSLFLDPTNTKSPSMYHVPAIRYDEENDVVTYFDDAELAHLYIQIPTNLRYLIKGVYILLPSNTKDGYGDQEALKFPVNSDGIAELYFPTELITNDTIIYEQEATDVIEVGFGIDTTQTLPCSSGTNLIILNMEGGIGYNITNEENIVLDYINNIPLVQDTKGYTKFRGQPYVDGAIVPYGVRYGYTPTDTIEITSDCLYPEEEEEDPIELT